MNLCEIINEHLFLYDQNLTTQIHNSLLLFVTTNHWISKKNSFHCTNLLRQRMSLDDWSKKRNFITRAHLSIPRLLSKKGRVALG